LFKKISENSENLVWQGGATGWYIPRMDLLGLHSLFRPWFQIWVVVMWKIMAHNLNMAHWHICATTLTFDNYIEENACIPCLQ